MQHDMTKYYEVSSFLRGELHMDREYPVKLDNISLNGDYPPVEHVTPVDKVTYSSDNSTVHDVSLMFQDLESNEKVLFDISNQSYSRSQEVSFVIQSDTEIDISKIVLGFSQSDTGIPLDMELSPINGGTIEPHTIKRISFEMTKTSKLDVRNRELNNVSSIIIQLNQEINRIWISDVVLNNKKFDFTLEDIDKQLNEAKNYIRKRLNVIAKEIPESLEYLLPKIAAFFIHRIRWQSEGEYQNDRNANRYNYAQELKSEVDFDIEQYNHDNTDVDENEIDGSVARFTNITT